MDKLPVGQLPDLLSSNNDDEIMVITNSEYNQLKKEKISDLITDFTSTNENNALTKGTDGKMFVTDFGNASNITEGTLPVSVLPDIPKDLLPAIETSDLPVSGVTADTYAYPSSVTVNAQGQVTAIEEGSPSGANANTDLSNITDAGKEVIKENSGGSGIPPSICMALRKSQNGTSVSLKWRDPDDTTNEQGQILCTWAKTIIVRKQGSYPEHESDGTVIVTNTVRNAYNLSAYVDTLPDSTNTYYYRAFPVSANGVVCLDPQNKFGQTVYEFVIDPNDSNPKTCVSYVGTNKDYTPAFMDYDKDEFNYGDWDKAFFMGLFRPCMLNPNGTVKHYLDPNDYTLQADGVTPSDVANTSQDANAMVEIGQIWIKEEEVNGRFHISIANEKISDDYDCYTHIKSDGTYNEFIYRSIYDGCNLNSKIRSLSGQAICKNVAGDTQISYAKANGNNWGIDEYNLRRLINYLLILIGKSLDTQTTFGTGRYSGGSQQSNNQLNTGTLDKKGMFYGDDSNGAVKVFHIENWWGNIWKITNGVIQSAGKLLYKMCKSTQDGSTASDYNTTGSGYIESGVVATGTITEQYIKKMNLVPGLGLVPTNTAGGSSSTYFCDGWWSNSSVVGFARFGGGPIHGLLVGAFAFAVNVAVSGSDWGYGVSLSYNPS